MDAKTADWPKLRKDLEALLDKPPEQKQDKKDDQKQQDQQKNEDQQKQDQKQQDQSKQDQQQKQDQSQKKDDPSDSKDPSQDKQQKDQSKKPEDSQKKDSAFGDMKNREPQPPPQPQPADNQKVGGVPEKPEGEQPPVDPTLALPLQKLDQLRNHDSPAELFKLMEGEKDSTPRKKTKDW
jgi:Ca-activated chloride channel family protein